MQWLNHGAPSWVMHRLEWHGREPWSPLTGAGHQRQRQLLCLQETFLSKQDFGQLSSLNPDFHGAGEATTDLSMGIVRGRIPWGVVILWRKQLDPLINAIRVDADWCIAIHYTHNNKEFVIMNVYTSFECDQNEDEYLNKLAFIQYNSHTSVIGDLNADILDRRSKFGNHLKGFCEDSNLTLSSD